MCGIVGISADQDIAIELYDSLIHLQHRGQDTAGIVTTNNDKLEYQHGVGLAREIFNSDNLSQLHGHCGIAHVRYPTAGGHSMTEVQPLVTDTPCWLALGHNGNLVNQQQLREEMIAQGYHFESSSDSEILLRLLAQSLDQLPDSVSEKEIFDNLCYFISHLYQKAKGGYSVVAVAAKYGLIAFRDPHGIRPLAMGERINQNDGKDYIIASEPTMFYALDFSQRQDIAAGELVFIAKSGKIYRQRISISTHKPCVFEYVYFARPDAKLDEVSVYRARLRMGQNLAKRWLQQYPDCLPDIVIPAPFTANTSALAFAHELGARYSEGLYKNPFIGRTFIMSTQKQRKKFVRYKLTPQETEIRGKSVLVLDDSIVRGTTSREIVRMIRENGAKEIYFASASPPIISPCFYGIDTPTKKELLAANKSIDQIRAYLGVNKLLYQNIDDLVEAVTRKGEHDIQNPCLACMNGCYITGDITEQKMQQWEIDRYRANQ